MKVNTNSPSFISFLENITNNILSAVKIEEYFKLSPDKKYTVSFTVLNLLKNSAKVKANLSDSELKSFITVLWRKNEELENYEFAAVLSDVIKDYDKLNEKIKRQPKRGKKPSSKAQE